MASRGGLPKQISLFTNVNGKWHKSDLPGSPAWLARLPAALRPSFSLLRELCVVIIRDFFGAAVVYRPWVAARPPELENNNFRSNIKSFGRIKIQ